MRGEEKSLAKTLKGTVMEILGTAFSTGCQVDGKSPKLVQEELMNGEYEGTSWYRLHRIYKLTASSGGLKDIFLADTVWRHDDQAFDINMNCVRTTSRCDYAAL